MWGKRLFYGENKENFVIHSENEKVDFASIDKVQDGKIFGNLKKGRLKIGDQVFFHEGDFVANIDDLLVKKKVSISGEMYKEINLEEAKKKGFLFAGSKSSKKIHDINSHFVKRISSENIIFFRSLLEAESLGFIL